MKHIKLLTIFAAVFATSLSTNSSSKNNQLASIQHTTLPLSLPISIFSHRPLEETYEEKKMRLITIFCGKYDVPENLVYAMIDQESSGNHKAISPKGALGYMQLMPGTAKELGVDPKDPFDNLRGGIMYIGKHLKRYDGNVKLALAAYNAGPKNVSKYGGVPPFKETQNYVKKIVDRIEGNV